MLRDYFLNKVENAIEKAIVANKLGQMTEYTKGTLSVEKPKNPDFGDFAINVSSLARSARIAPPIIANSILEFIDKEDSVANQYITPLCQLVKMANQLVSIELYRKYKEQNKENN